MPIDQSDATLEFYKSHPNAMKAGLTDEDIMERHAKLPPMQQWNIESAAKTARRGRELTAQVKEKFGGPRKVETDNYTMAWNAKPKLQEDGSRSDIEAGAIALPEAQLRKLTGDAAFGSFTNDKGTSDPLRLRDPETRLAGKTKAEQERGWLTQPNYEDRVISASKQPTPKRQNDAMVEQAQRLAIDIQTATGDRNMASLVAKYTLDKWRGTLDEADYASKMDAIANEYYAEQHRLTDSASIFNTATPRSPIGAARN
jgi:hypothetical protein